MFDKFRLKEVLVQYKKDFLPKHWEDEKYKWEAVKCFQDNWDVKAEDFADMLSRSLSKTYNLLASMNNFPAGMITGFARPLLRKSGRCILICLMRPKRSTSVSTPSRCSPPSSREIWKRSRAALSVRECHHNLPVASLSG
jgi:hypothetical protein